MPITAAWERTNTDVKGDQTEVILPLCGLERVHPNEDRHIASILREARPEPDEEDRVLWEKLKLDREECSLHLVVSEEPDVARIKQIVDEALRCASEALVQNMKERDRLEAEARIQQELRERQASSIRDAFRVS